jgi:hypothetical protein
MSTPVQVKAKRNIDVVVSAVDTRCTVDKYDVHAFWQWRHGDVPHWMTPERGPGQFINQWLAYWSRLHYKGARRDLHGINCPHTSTSTCNYNNQRILT